MSGLISANSLQSTPMSPASRRCSGRSVLLPDADGTLGVHHERPLLPRQQHVALGFGRTPAASVDEVADLLAAEMVARDIGRERGDHLAAAPHPAVAHEQRRGDPRQRAAGCPAYNVAARD